MREPDALLAEFQARLELRFCHADFLQLEEKYKRLQAALVARELLELWNAALLRRLEEQGRQTWEQQQRAGRLQQALDGMHGRITDLVRRLAAAERELDELRASNRTLAHTLERRADGMDPLTAALRSHADRLESRLAALTAAVRRALETIKACEKLRGHEHSAWNELAALADAEASR